MNDWMWAAVGFIVWVVVVLVVPGALFISPGVVVVLASIVVYAIWAREQSAAWKWLLPLGGLLGVGFVFVGLGLS